MAGSRRRKPWVTVLVASALGVSAGGWNEALHGLLSDGAWDWSVMTLYVVLWTVLLPPLWWVIWRAVDRGQIQQSPAKRDRDQRKEFVSRAVATGALPPNANSDAWRRALRDQIREWNGLRWFAVGYTAVNAGLIGTAAVVANENSWSVWAVAVVLAAAGVVVFRRLGQQIHPARRLLLAVTTS